jgi:hypothetical protein
MLLVIFESGKELFSQIALIMSMIYMTISSVA